MHAGSSVHIGIGFTEDNEIAGDSCDGSSGLSGLRGGYDGVAVDKVESLVNVVNSVFDSVVERGNTNSRLDLVSEKNVFLNNDNRVEEIEEAKKEMVQDSTDDVDDVSDGIVLKKTKEILKDSDEKVYIYQ